MPRYFDANGTELRLQGDFWSGVVIYRCARPGLGTPLCAFASRRALERALQPLGVDRLCVDLDQGDAIAGDPMVNS